MRAAAPERHLEKAVADHHLPWQFITSVAANSLGLGKPASMGWFRSNRSGVAGLALFALALQLLLAFGHVHFDKNTNSAWVGSGGYNKVAQLGNPSSKQKPAGLGTEFCAICATIKLASAVVTPTAPESFHLELSAVARAWWPEAVEPPRLQYPPLLPRGPPQA